MRQDRGRLAPSLVVSSAGNTARAFHRACSRYDVPALIVVPEHSLPLLWSTRRAAARQVRLAVLEGGADYADAIELGNGIAATDGYYPRAGRAMPRAATAWARRSWRPWSTTGRIPDHYFQAVGSGTGAIAAWEMSLGSAEDGRFGDAKMRLHLCQNAPFTPMTDAWEAGSRTLSRHARRRASASRGSARSVLANRNPPYAIAGGLFDASPTPAASCIA